MSSEQQRYQILEKIGAGSFATVYRARDVELGREVAIKQLHQQFLEDPRQLARYWLEAQLLASLHHPNIVTIFDVDRERGWLIMELMQGNLAERLGGKPMDLRALRATLAHCLRALKYLHEQGVIHGDIKPGNMMIDSRKRVKIGDFGLARRASDDEGSLLKGTTRYMAPEMVSDDFGDVGPASDLYSLGFSAYSLLCGENFDQLFPGLNAFGRDRQIAWMMWHAAPDRRLPEIRRVLEGVPEDIARVVQKLTEKDQSLRYKSADEALSDLQVDLKVVGGGDEPPPSDDSGARRRVWVAAGALGFSLVMSAAMLFWPSGKPPSVRSEHTVNGILHKILPNDSRIIVQDAHSGALEEFELPRKQKIFLQNDKRNILLRELQPGDLLTIELDANRTSLALGINVDRPVRSHGVVKQLNLPEQRLVITLSEGSLRDDLPVHVPAAAILELNGARAKLADLQVGDHVAFAHVTESGGRASRLLQSLRASRLVGTVGSLREVLDDGRRLRIQVGPSGGATLDLPLADNCRISVNGEVTRAGVSLTSADLAPGDRLSLKHDTLIRELQVTRSETLDGVIEKLDPAGRELLVIAPDGQRQTVLLDPQTEVTLGLEKVTQSSLRRFDAVRVSGFTSSGTLRASAIDARRPTQADRWAVVIGTQSYTDTSLSPVKTALDDARLVHSALLKRYALSDHRGSLLLDATLEEWKQTFENVLTAAKPATQVIIYITGHAYRTDDGKVYLAPRDFDSARMTETGLPLAWLIERLEACPSTDKLLLWDCTPEGSGRDLQRQPAGKEILDELNSPLQSTTIVMSCDADQRSHVWNERRRGLFAASLAEAFDGAADADRDLHLTAPELMNALTPAMRDAEARTGHPQTPVLIRPQAR
ncbi:serine/threonine-protein kinase [Planctellipticum variicoloris]|uniref:serine/threonine-protein kinase n=1 Tax=Planctellipticum variicoloris TaxID=3064265 RepID=UPI003013E7E5|nr:serine/threonine protein kinase [Planctomycetaceae bacterium SH412]